MPQAKINEKVKGEILGRWNDGGFSSFQTFAPYSWYCMKVDFVFKMALEHNLIGTRSTNYVDREYLLYLPFCQVFSSGDRLQENLCQLFLREDQVFKNREQMKQELGLIQ